MVRQGLAGLTLVTSLLVAGCSPAMALQGSRPPYATSAGVAAQLPRSVAGPPVTLNLPRRIHNVSLMRAIYQNGHVTLFTKASWHGKVVTLYYVPAQNVIHGGDHYDLKSAVNVQKIGQTHVHSDGTWSYVWDAQGLKVPVHRGWFFLAKSELDEVALLQLNTFN